MYASLFFFQCADEGLHCSECPKAHLARIIGARAGHEPAYSAQSIIVELTYKRRLSCLPDQHRLVTTFATSILGADLCSHIVFYPQHNHTNFSMSSDAFTDLRAWLQGTANTTTEEEPFLTANPVPHQGPHASDAPEGDEDLEGLFAGFNWDLSSHGLPEVCSRVFLRLHIAYASSDQYYTSSFF